MKAGGGEGGQAAIGAMKFGQPGQTIKMGPNYSQAEITAFGIIDKGDGLTRASALYPLV